MGKALTIVTEVLMLSEVLDVGNGQLDIWLLVIWIWKLNSEDVGSNEWISEQVCRLLRNEKQDKTEDSGDSGGGQEFWFWLW